MKKILNNLFLGLLLFFSLTGHVLADFQKIKIAVLPFTLQGENFETEDMGKIVSEWLITAFVKKGRFEVIERKLLTQILKEQQMVETGIVNQETAFELGRILGARVIISGSVMRLRNVVEVNARIIDVTSGSIITAENVRSADLNNLQNLVVEMADKIIGDFPLEGYIVNREQKEVVIDLGKEAGVEPGTQFMVYEEGDIVRHPKTDEIVYVKQVKTGTIQITRAMATISEGFIVEEVSLNTIKYGNYVKTLLPEEEKIVLEKSANQNATGQRISSGSGGEQQRNIKPAEQAIVTPIYQKQEGSHSRLKAAIFPILLLGKNKQPSNKLFVHIAKAFGLANKELKLFRLTHASSKISMGLHQSGILDVESTIRNTDFKKIIWQKTNWYSGTNPNPKIVATFGQTLGVDVIIMYQFNIRPGEDFMRIFLVDVETKDFVVETFDYFHSDNGPKVGLRKITLNAFKEYKKKKGI